MKTILYWAVPAVLLILHGLTTAGEVDGGGDSDRNARSILLDATVRIRVADGNVFDYASGTIISRVGSQALIATCAHVFEETPDDGSIRVTTFARDGIKRDLTAWVIAIDAESDIALLGVDGVGAVTPIPLANIETRVDVGDDVLVGGCDDGGSPECWQTGVTAVNRFLGSPNLGVAAMPRHGRSGGGLVNAKLQLIGICNGINKLHEEGVYAAASELHRLADPATWRGRDDLPEFPGQVVADVPPPSSREGSRTMTASSSDQGTEVIVIIRSKSETGAPSEVLVLQDASPELLSVLREQSSRR